MPPLRSTTVTASLIAFVILGSAACADRAGTARSAAPPAATTVPMRCTETTATPLDGRPSALAETTAAWFGQGDLWVGLPDDPAAQGDTLVLKFPIVTLADGEPTSDLGPPAVTATRADAPGDVTGSVGGFSRAFGTGELAFWPATVAFPAPGCWTVTSTIGATAVQYVVRVDRP